MAEELHRTQPMLETVEGMRKIVFAQTRQIDQCLSLLARTRDGETDLLQGDPEVLRIVLTMIHMAGISGHSILKMTDGVNLSVRDAYPIARSVIEGVVNICFIMAGGREVAARAVRHAEVKAYQDLKRKWEVGGTTMILGYSGKLPPQEIERLNSMLPEFTTKKGREKDWTDATLKQRLNVVAQTFADSTMILLNGSAFNIYRHASEISHGSYFSAIHFWGLSLPGRGEPLSLGDFRLTLLDHQFSVLLSTVFAYAGLVKCFADYANLPELHAGANSELNRLWKLPAIAETLADSDRNG